MAIRLEDTYPASRITPADADYPAGSLKNETTPGVSNDGTPLDKLWGNDREGFFQALLNAASITANGSPDTVLSSQYLQAVVSLASGLASSGVDVGAANAYVVNLPSGVIPPDALFNGLTVSFFPLNNNTGASTLNFGGLAAFDLRDEDDKPLTGGELVAGNLAVARYNLSTLHWELIRHSKTGSSNIVVFTSSGAYSPPAGVKALRFTATGGGGGAGGVDGQGAGTSAVSIGGGAGGTAILNVTNIASSYTITIGAGGAGGLAGNNNGANGGTTTVVGTGVNISCSGGTGGFGDIGTSGDSSPSGVGGGPASGGDINTEGGGSQGLAVVGGASAGACNGAASYWGGGARGLVNNPGEDALAWGAGGGGTTHQEATTTNRAGGDGANGIVIVEEFF